MVPEVRQLINYVFVRNSYLKIQWFGCNSSQFSSFNFQLRLCIHGLNIILYLNLLSKKDNILDIITLIVIYNRVSNDFGNYDLLFELFL